MSRILVGVFAVIVLAGVFVLGRQSTDALEAQPSPPGAHQMGDRVEIFGESDRVERAYRFSTWVRQLGPQGLASALGVFEEHSRELPRAEIRLFMSGWARFDPEAAFEYALFAPEVNRHTMASAVMYTWAQGDPVAAQGALLGVRNTSLGRALEEHFILGQISVGGLELVHEYTEDLRPSKRRELLVGHIAQALAMQSADTVIDWAEAVDDDDSRFRRTVFNKTAGALAQYNHERGVEWVVGHYGEPDARGSARLLALRWADSDPDAAFAWLSSLPGGEEKNDATGFVFAYWLNSRPEEASAWLAQRDHGVALDPAMRTMALSKIAESPPVAIEWARRVHDSGIRERTLVQIAKAWLGSDPEAARRWLAASGLPRSARKNVLGGSR